MRAKPKTSPSAAAAASERPTRVGRLQACQDWVRGNLVLLGLLALTAACFLAFAVAAHRVPYFPVDLTITRALQSVQHPLLSDVAERVSWPGFPPQSNVLFGSIILVLLLRRRLAAALCQVLAAGGSAVLWFQVAPLVARPRPSPELVNVSFSISHGSFPSGHVLNFTAGLGFTWFLVYTLLPRSAFRTVVLWTIPIYLALLGVARVYSGQHWASDVLGGYLLGALWLWLTIWIYRRAEPGIAACTTWVRGRWSQRRPQPPRPTPASAR